MGDGGGLIGLRSSPVRGEWLGKARVQMRSNGRASKGERRKAEGAKVSTNSLGRDA
jgi:hypothetical protein